MTTSFNVGDRVEYVQNNQGRFFKAADIGRVGTVVWLDSLSDSVDVTYDDDRKPKTRNVYKCNLRPIASPPKFKVGDTVKITDAAAAASFIGLRAVVTRASGCCPGEVQIRPLSDRPDTGNRTPFFWQAKYLAPVSKKAEAAAELKAAAEELSKLGDELFELELKITRLVAALS